MKTLSSPRPVKSVPLGRQLLYNRTKGTPARGSFSNKTLNLDRNRFVPARGTAPNCPGLLGWIADILLLQSDLNRRGFSIFTTEGARRC
jgi:hypothetical protein